MADPQFSGALCAKLPATAHKGKELAKWLYSAHQSFGNFKGKMTQRRESVNEATKDLKGEVGWLLEQQYLMVTSNKYNGPTATLGCSRADPCYLPNQHSHIPVISCSTISALPLSWPSSLKAKEAQTRLTAPWDAKFSPLNKHTTD
ncbi:hypothetical protein WISP_66531 [Willisornis vidua]|uniref:Uncharacterized protein n=1 Tax=Willisornis vidua TaxID=1566151 RepID=A0ABQ9D8U5_9PASS|nr:hypothetical protein WISP_66531 [Willisornis vidua]